MSALECCPDVEQPGSFVEISETETNEAYPLYDLTTKVSEQI